MKGKRRSGEAVPCEGDLTPRTAVLGLGLLLFLATPAQLQQLRIESGSVLTPCRETRGQLPGGALSYDYTKALLARVEACALFNRRFMAEVVGTPTVRARGIASVESSTVGRCSRRDSTRCPESDPGLLDHTAVHSEGRPDSLSRDIAVPPKSGRRAEECERVVGTPTVRARGIASVESSTVGRCSRRDSTRCPESDPGLLDHTAVHSEGRPDSLSRDIAVPPKSGRRAEECERNLPLELSALTVTPRIEVPSSNELKRLTEEQAFLRIYQLLVAYSSFAQHTANTSIAPGCGRPSKRTGAALLGAAQRNADQLQELRCDVRLSSGAHGSKAQFEVADASAQGLLLDTYADCSKRLLEDYRVALGIQKLLHSVRGYLVHLVRLKSPFQGAEVAELSSAVEALEPAAY
ncbi:uncharacterized protein ISCGN_026175 [Ixodes scapularis]